jgi:hypothetical protein
MLQRMTQHKSCSLSLFVSQGVGLSSIVEGVLYRVSPFKQRCNPVSVVFDAFFTETES